MENSKADGNLVSVIIERRSPLNRCYNVAAQLSQDSIQHFALPVHHASLGMRDIGYLGSGLVFEIQKTAPGIEDIYLSRYAITICINVAFSWDNIEPAILAAIEAAVGPIAVREPEPHVDGVIVVVDLSELIDDGFLDEVDDPT